MTVLVLTVGGSPEPLLTAIRSLRPDRVVFLCSDDSSAAKGSYTQVTGDQGVAKQAGLLPEQWEVVKIPNFDSLQDCYRVTRQVVEKLRRDHSDARLIVDYTGGTKSMTAGAAMAAADDEHCDLNLVTGTRANLQTVRSGTEYARPIGVFDLRAVRKLDEVENRLYRFDYVGAASLLEDIGRTQISEELQRKVRAGIAICRGFDTWDRFDHQTARSFLDPYRRWLPTWREMLDDLCQVDEKRRDPYIQVEDLLLNTERRAAQGRYDDAVARIYRTLELIAQLRLRTKHGIDAANADIAKVPSSFRSELERHRSEDGKLRLSLFAIWRLLGALGDELGKWFDGHRAAMQGWVEMRNFSIYAHGLEPIGADIYERDGQRGIALCREALGCLPAPERRVISVKQLPQTLAECIPDL